MATLAGGQRNALTLLLRRWERRQRFQRTWLWLPRSLLPGLGLGLALLLWTRLRFAAPGEGLLLPTALLAAGGLLLLLAGVWLRPRPALPLARKFEREFALNERLSTALELIEGRIRSSPELAERQVADARNRAQALDAAAQLPLRSDRRAWALLLLTALAFGLTLRLPLPETPAGPQEEAQEAAIDEAAAAVERIADDVARDSALPEELREQLQRELERSSTLLGQEALSPEEAFAALSESADRLEQQALDVQESVRQQMQALAQAGGEQLANALQELANAGSLPGDNDMLRRMEEAAAALEENNPELAEAIRRAVEDARAFQNQAARSSAQLATQMLARQQGQMALAQESQQRLQTASEQLRGSAEQIARQGQPPALSSQRRMEQPAISEMQQGGDLSMQGQSRDGQGGQAGQNEEAGAMPGSSSQAGVGDEALPGAQQGSQPGGNQMAEGAGEQIVPGQGGMAGDAPGDAGSDEGFAGQQGAPPGQRNNPDGRGVGEFAPVYAPRRIGAGEGPEIFLETDPGDAPLVEGDFAPNPAGEALVPWNEIYGDYRDAASRALESDYIPLGLRDVVHDYFSALEPGQ